MSKTNFTLVGKTADMAKDINFAALLCVGSVKITGGSLETFYIEKNEGDLINIIDSLKQRDIHVEVGSSNFIINLTQEQAKQYLIPGRR